MSKELNEMCPLGEKNGQDLAQTSRKWRKKISNGESDGERKIYPSANPGYGYSIILVNIIKQYYSVTSPSHTSPSGQYLLMAWYWPVTKGKVPINLTL